MFKSTKKNCVWFTASYLHHLLIQNDKKHLLVDELVMHIYDNNNY